MERLERRSRPHLPRYGPPREEFAGPSLTVAEAPAKAPAETPDEAPTALPPARSPEIQHKPRMGTFWRATALALVLFACANVLAARWEPYFARVNTYTGHFDPSQALADYYENPRADIIYMGSSRVQDGFDPVIVDQALHARGLNVRSLNLAIGGGGADAAYLLLKNIVQDDKKPKILVYGLAEFEVHAGFPGSSRLDYYSTLMRPTDIGLYGGSSLGSRLRFLAQELPEGVMPLYRDRDLIRNALSIEYNPEDPSHKQYIPGPSQWPTITNGHHTVPASYRTTPTELQHDIDGNKPGLQNWSGGGHTEQCLEALFDLAHARGIQMVLVNLPVSAVHLGLWGPGNLEKYRALVRTITQQHHVPLLDLYTNPGGMIPQEYFAGTNHLNQGGAEILSQAFANYVAAACGGVLAGRGSAGSCGDPPANP